MDNRITITIEFDFKGIHFSPSGDFDLDKIMRNNGVIPDLCATLATLNGIDLYSYEFEIMQEEEIQFSNPQGLAAEYMIEGVFDKVGFTQRWHLEQALSALQKIATQHMAIENLNQQPQLKAALMAAFQLGRERPKIHHNDFDL